MNSTIELLKTADLELNTYNQQVFKNKQLVKLSDLSFNTLMCLIKASPHHVTVDQLMDEVWQAVAVSPETVTQRIAMIRKALSSEGDSHEKYIVSIRSKGYRWVPSVNPVKPNSSRQWVLVFIPLVLLVIYWLIDSTDKTESVVEPQIKSTINANDYTNQAWHYLDKHEVKSNELAIGLFRKSLEANPNHLDALTGLSIALSHQVTKFNEPAELLLEAKTVAQQAIKINPKHGQAWAALAFVFDADGDINQAVTHYEKALEFNPSNSSTASSLSYLYGEQGRLVDAMQLNIGVLGSKQLYLDLQIANILSLLGFDSNAEKWFKKADELSPDNVFATHIRARFYLSRNQYQLADQIVTAAISRGIKRPELPLVKGILAYIKGEPKVALSLIEQAVAIDPADIEPQVWLFILQNPEHVTEEAKQAFTQQWLSDSYSWPELWIYQALFYAHCADQDLAFESLFKAFATGYRNHRWLVQLPPFDVLKSDHRWLRLMELMQNDVSEQRQRLIEADWLPTSFLDPSN